MIEVERKRQISSTDEPVIRSRLTEANYHATSTMVEVDTYYSRPDVDFLQTVECLRVRQSDGFAEITYKPASTATTHSAADIIAKQETNLILRDAADAETAHQFLTNLGMVFLARVEKVRTTYRNPTSPDITVTVDAVTDVGMFIETEINATDPDTATVLLEATEQQLKVTGLPVISLPYRDLVLQLN
ncbi:hypothetical protein GCM10011581_04550 [Saccharopolyspora subtropica]|uniref:CYTH domain-containing protein n=1 Tax=Saccharopolyspora thermophila TaxID=89367 RepID=A0A917N742_9PSEU|nr:class IV adenylate cyclase [Saccharopolyspora subtropica]GGI70646.1 hypothetical protein GCM10011581_04550 [Saccharopolyspora subtropica]